MKLFLQTVRCILCECKVSGTHKRMSRKEEAIKAEDGVITHELTKLRQSTMAANIMRNVRLTGQCQALDEDQQELLGRVCN